MKTFAHRPAEVRQRITDYPGWRVLVVSMVLGLLFATLGMLVFGLA